MNKIIILILIVILFSGCVFDDLIPLKNRIDSFIYSEKIIKVKNLAKVKDIFEME